ncbi:MAG: hypothetical protein ACI80V_003336 [Rhodothermales bacterium]|jgi:hypothetical protein
MTLPSPEGFIGCDDEELHVGIIACASLGDGAPNDQTQVGRVIPIGLRQPVDGPLVVVSDRNLSHAQLAGPLKVLVGLGDEVWIQPTERWRVMEVETSGASVFAVDPGFYVEDRPVGY